MTSAISMNSARKAEFFAFISLCFEHKNNMGSIYSKRMFGIAFVPAFCLNLNFFFAKIECGLYFLDRFDVLISKIIFKK
jgi:hypothetical protein